MSVETLVTTAYSVGNGVSVAFTLPFYFINTSHIVITLDGVVQTSGFTIAGLRVPAGGTVTFDVAPSSGVIVGRKRVLPIDQEVDTQNNQTIFEDVFDDGLDYRCMVEQQLETEIGRAVQYPEGEELLNAVLPVAADRLGKTLGFDPVTGEVIVYTPATFPPVLVSNAIVVVASKSALKAVSVTGLATDTIALVLGEYTRGDCDARFYRFVSGDTVDDDGGWNIAPNGGVTGRWKYDGPKDVLRPEHFGAITSATDNSDAFKKAILAAAANNVKTIGWAGMMRFTARITQNISGVSGEDYAVPDGLEFVGLGPFAPDQLNGATQAGVRWDGSGTWWDQRNPNGSGSVGNWKFRDLKFSTTTAAADVFHFGYTDIAGNPYTPADSGSNPCFTKNVSFFGCYALGAHGPGDFIDACKVFELYIDPTCLITNWRRGVNLKGCDQPKLFGRYDLNGRGIHNERSSTFGNNCRIVIGQMASSDSGSTSETKYFIYDTGEATIIEVGQLEEAAGVPATAYLYLGGSNTRILAAHFNSAAIAPLELAAGAINVMMLDPQAPVGGVTTPIIDAASAYNWGDNGGDARLHVIRPSRNIIEAFGRDPRIMYHDAWPGSKVSQEDSLTYGNISSNGGRRQHLYMDARNFFGSVDGISTWTVPLAGMSADTTLLSGIKMEQDNGQGYAIKLICGTHFLNGDYIRWNTRGRHNAAHTGTEDYHIRKNGGADITSGNLSNNTTYTNNWIDYTTSGFSVGDELQLIVANATNGRYYIAEQEVFVTESQITDCPATGAFADLAAVATYVNSTLKPYLDAVVGKTRTRI